MIELHHKAIGDEQIMHYQIEGGSPTIKVPAVQVRLKSMDTGEFYGLCSIRMDGKKVNTAIGGEDNTHSALYYYAAMTEAVPALAAYQEDLLTLIIHWQKLLLVLNSMHRLQFHQTEYVKNLSEVLHVPYQENDVAGSEDACSARLLQELAEFPEFGEELLKEPERKGEQIWQKSY